MEGTGGNVAVLARKVTHLAAGGVDIVARWCLATDVWVQMSQGAGAVAVGGDWLVVNVVH